MIFSSLQYAVFLIAVVVVYYLLPNIKSRNIFLLIGSYYFYASWNIKLLLLICGLTLLAYISAIVIERKRAYGKIMMITTVSTSLFILFLFKYFNFFAKSLESLVKLFRISQSDFIVLNLLLPVGISFYTFQALSYVIDVYKGKIHAEKNIIDFALYISFFPQLVAGPIERPDHFLPQLKIFHRWNWGDVEVALSYIVWGLFKKLVIADKIALFVDVIYDDVAAYSALVLVVATIGFSIQIYCDFSAYSEIAMGSALLLGIRLNENFNCPYLATSLKDFWARWHISLSTWFRDYVYIPLGGNRKGRIRADINLLVTFLISGLWHGANWTYVVWGGVHGLGQVLERIFVPKKMNAIWKILYRCIVMLWVCFAWIFFRANSLSDAAIVIKKIIGCRSVSLLEDKSIIWELGFDKWYWLVVVVAICILLINDIIKKKKMYWFQKKSGSILIPVHVLVLVVSIVLFGVYGPMYDAAAFIYFQF